MCHVLQLILELSIFILFTLLDLFSNCNVHSWTFSNFNLAVSMWLIYKADKFLSMYMYKYGEKRQPQSSSLFNTASDTEKVAWISHVWCWSYVGNMFFKNT